MTKYLQYEYIVELMSHLMKAEVSGYEIIEKIVKQSGNSGRVYVPIDWVGKKVKIVLLDPVENNKES